MYLDFFSFSEKPFGVTPDTRFLYLSPQHEEAIEVLNYGIRDRRGFMMLTGEVGTGKTTSIRALLNRIDEKTETALVINPLLSTAELLRAINRDFGISTTSTSLQEQVEALNTFLLERDREDKNAVVIIDEAQDLSMEALEMVRLLSNLETETHKLLQLILVGQPELEDKVNSPDLRQLRQRMQVKHSLRSLDFEETKKYVLFRLNMAAPKCCLVFQPSALKKIYQHSGGVPRLINHLCELTLLAAYTEETHIVTKRLVELGHREMADQSPKKAFGWFRRASGGKNVASP